MGDDNIIIVTNAQIVYVGTSILISATILYHVRHFCVDTCINIKLKSSFNTGPIDIVGANKNVVSAYLTRGKVMKPFFMSAHHHTLSRCPYFAYSTQLGNICVSTVHGRQCFTMRGTQYQMSPSALTIGQTDILSKRPTMHMCF